MALNLGYFQIERRAAIRQFLFVLGTVDLALVLLFTIMGDWNEFESVRDWWQNRVEAFDFTESMVDLMLLAVIRFVALILCSLNTPGFRFNLFLLTFFVLMLPYFVVKAILYDVPYTWATYCLFSSCFVGVLLEIILLFYGHRLGSKSSPDYGGENDWESIDGPQEDEEVAPLIRTSYRGTQINGEPDREETVHQGFVTPPELSSPGRSRASTQMSTFSQDSQVLREKERSAQSIFHRLVQKGVHMTWNNQFTEAEKELTRCSAFCPRHALHYAEIAMVKQAITGKLKEKELTLQLLTKAEQLAHQIISSPKELATYQRRMEDLGLFDYDLSALETQRNWRWDVEVVIADCLLWRAVFQMGMGQEIRGAFNLRKSWKSYESILASVEEAKNNNIRVDKGVYHSLLFGVAFFYFIVSIVPGTYLKILEVIGFVANRDLGVSYLHKVHEFGGVRTPAAAAILAMNYLFIPRALMDVKEQLAAAGPVVNACLRNYPNGSLFLFMASHFARKTGKVDDAIPYLDRAIQESRNNGLTPNNYIFELGSCHYMKLDWEKAAQIFEALVNDESNEFELKGFCVLHLCSCLLMMNKKEEAFAILPRVPDLIVNKGNRYSKIAIAMTERILETRAAPFLAFEFHYLKRDLAHMERGALEKSLEILDEIVKTVSLSDLDNIGAYMLLKGTILKLVGRTDEALPILDSLVGMKAQEMTSRYVVPFGQWERGELLYKRGDVKGAEKAFAEVLAFKGTYDFSDVLRNRIRLANLQIEKDKKSGKLS